MNRWGKFLNHQVYYQKSGGFSVSSPFGGGGISYSSEEPFILEPIEKSEEKIIFVENAQELDNKALGLIIEATNRNNKLRFILEIPTPHMKDSKLKPGSYKIVEVGELDYESTKKLVKNANPKLSDKVVEKIADKSKGYPYIARTLAYICTNQNTEEQMLESLQTLRDDERYLLDDIHGQVLETLKDDAQVTIKKLAIAPPILTWKVIEAFCGKGKDASLSDIIVRGILRTEEKSYWIYHPLFGDYLREEKINPGAIENKKEIYRDAMERIKSEFDSIYILFETLTEPDIFKELIEFSENYNALYSIGAQSLTWGIIEQTILSWSRILKRAKESEDKKWLSIATRNMGNVYQIRGDLDKALEYYGKALKLAEELGNKEGTAKNYVNMGIVYGIRGDLDKALEYHGKALKLDEELGSKVWTAQNYGNMGNVYQIRGDLDKALEYHGKALKLAEELGNKEGMANIYGNTGNVYQIRGDLDKALEYYGKALKLAEELGSKVGMANIYGNMGIVYGIRGDLDKALEYCGKALRVFKEMKNGIQIAQTLMHIGDILVSKDKKERAIDYYLEAQELQSRACHFLKL